MTTCQRTQCNCKELDILKEKDILEMFASVSETQTTSGEGQPHHKVQWAHSLSRDIFKVTTMLTFMTSRKSWAQSSCTGLAHAPQYTEVPPEG